MYRILSCVFHVKVAVARREEIIKKQDEAIRSLEVINQLTLKSQQLLFCGTYLLQEPTSWKFKA